MSKLFKTAFLNAVGVGVYIAVVGFIINFGDQLFGGNGLPSMIGVLTLMTLSAAVVGSLIFAKPVMLYLDNQKKESIKLLFYTIGTLAILLAVYLVILALI